MSPAKINPFILASDNDPDLLPLLRSNPSLASSQDEHGYSILHAAVSYNHLNLLESIMTEFKPNINLKDEDGETALFVAETLPCAQLLVEKFGIDIAVRNVEGLTAREKIAEENDFPQVAVYLRKIELEREVASKPQSKEETKSEDTSQLFNDVPQAPPQLPEGVTVNVGTMNPDEVGQIVDPEFKKRIDELAQNPEFETEAGQAELRALIVQALHGEVGEQRDVRQRRS